MSTVAVENNLFTNINVSRQEGSVQPHAYSNAQLSSQFYTHDTHYLQDQLTQMAVGTIGHIASQLSQQVYDDLYTKEVLGGQSLQSLHQYLNQIDPTAADALYQSLEQRKREFQLKYGMAPAYSQSQNYTVPSIPLSGGGVSNSVMTHTPQPIGVSSSVNVAELEQGATHLYNAYRLSQGEAIVDSVLAIAARAGTGVLRGTAVDTAAEAAVETGIQVAASTLSTDAALGALGPIGIGIAALYGVYEVGNAISWNGETTWQHLEDAVFHKHW